MGHRYYDPTLGRFTQPDPSGQEKNAYLYAEGDPVNGIDPSGLYSIDDLVTDISIIGGSAGAGAGIGGGACFFGPQACGVGVGIGGFVGGAFGVGVVVGRHIA
ncbi:putative secreted protein [Streptomyces ambofaciens ATCC 23877]|uniref:Putative secreted protein n=1 Tax=Streptomyces ambofaciens (strain ATCC 23877 / 3486 / DSM 40053 / JCM 4204 / NBRC 12836 / NRRL B-2516) TaxID=278992 RepID=Q1RR53_STRA7|nr:putative secreted protein [Streptomyces ambofaciens ATCC 23877]AKZ60665.1 putative secreted protein [Streptomyces ambofaciens ATCC 23877]CAI77961.1 putative secreted protein [Streptomyces ambofaciens ATCC 23877]CAI78235.1 putative secreted protein [Streptomyces ambofaciens ATCC 23877]CAJ87742.1 putative secreted protein [Streptomyces ambofaciens ATCC 23877]